MEDITGMGTVAKSIVDKIAAAIGILYSDSDYKIKQESKRDFLKRVGESRDLCEYEKIAIISNFKSTFKEYKNKKDVIKIALGQVKGNVEPDRVDGDWLSYFFNQAKNISNKDIQFIWGKLLANEFEIAGSVPKTLIHTLSILDTYSATKFNRLCSLSVYLGDELAPFIVDANGCGEIIQKEGISDTDIFELEKLGLIYYNNIGYSYKGYEIHLGYKEYLYKVKRTCKGAINLHENGIYAGCVRLSRDGKALQKALEIVQSDLIPELIEKTYSNVNEWDIYEITKFNRKEAR